jgi:hypothetical protein
MFAHRKWIDKKSGWALTLTTEGDKQQALIDYQITVHTSDIRGAGLR